MNLQEARRKLEQKKGQKIELARSIDELHTKVKNETTELHYQEQAREIIKEVGLNTQRQLQYHISDIASMALESIFEQPYKLVLDFVERRNKTECDLLFERDGEPIDPMTASGGGAVDVAGFALRIGSWSMQHPKSSQTIILDEPFRFLSKNLQDRASTMIKQVSEKLGIQFIIITHEATLGMYADKVFQVTNRRGVSRVREVTR